MDRQFWLSGLIRFLIYFTHWMVLAHLPVIFLARGFSDIDIGLLIGVFSLSSMVLMIPMGMFSDVFSPKKILLMGAVSLFLYYLGLAKFTSFSLMVLLMVIGGFGAASLIVVSEALFLKKYGQDDRNRRISYYQGFTYFGFGLGPLCGGLLLVNAGAAALFYVASLVLAVLFICCSFLYDTTPITFSLRQYHQGFNDKRPLLLMATIIIIGVHFGVEQTSTALIMKEDVGLDSNEIGQIFCMLGLWMGFCAPVLARIKERSSAIFFYLFIGLFISGTFQMLTAWTTSYWTFTLVRGLHTFGDCIALLELSVLTALFFPSKRLGGSSGILYGMRTLATFTAAIMTGLLNYNFGYRPTFVLSGILMMLFSGCCLYWVSSNKRLRESFMWN